MTSTVSWRAPPRSLPFTSCFLLPDLLGTGVPRSHAIPLEPTVGLCLGPYGSLRGGAVSYERGAPVPPPPRQSERGPSNPQLKSHGSNLTSRVRLRGLRPARPRRARLGMTLEPLLWLCRSISGRCLLGIHHGNSVRWAQAGEGPLESAAQDSLVKFDQSSQVGTGPASHSRGSSAGVLAALAAASSKVSAASKVNLPAG